MNKDSVIIAFSELHECDNIFHFSNFAIYFPKYLSLSHVGQVDTANNIPSMSISDIKMNFFQYGSDLLDPYRN